MTGELIKQPGKYNRVKKVMPRRRAAPPKSKYPRERAISFKRKHNGLAVQKHKQQWLNHNRLDDLNKYITARWQIMNE